MAAIDMNDTRLKQVEAEKAQAIQNTENQYNQMINNTDAMYNQQIQATKDYAEQQKKFQQQQTDLAVSQINQQKEELTQNYTNEQKGAYTDYQKAIDQYGVQAEKQASAGLRNSGYSESSKVQAFTTYQNRYGVARQSYNNAIVKYNNDINQAQLANNSKLAEIAFNALEKQLTIALEGFQYKNTLIQNKIGQLNTVEDRFYNRYRDVVNQLNTEREFEEKQREHNEQMALQREQFAWQKAQAVASKARKSSSSTKKSTKSSNSAKALTDGASTSVSKVAQQISSNLKKKGDIVLNYDSSNAWGPINQMHASSYVYDKYKKGEISDSDANYIFKQIGM